MGRTEKSQGLAPPSVRKEVRAKQARHIINKVIPAILASNARARKGVEASVLIVDPGPVVHASLDDGEEPGRLKGEDAVYGKRKGQGRRKLKDEVVSEERHDTKRKGKDRKKNTSSPLEGQNNPSHRTPLSTSASTPNPSKKNLNIRIIATDTLTAARTLNRSPATPKSKQNICILNMASPLRPGGGVLTGATSQEEHLCARTTLLPSLRESFYRLPELGAIYSPDILAFRGPGPLGDAADELAKDERFWVDVVSASALRLPDLEGGEREVRRLGARDREMVEGKMRAVLRVMGMRGVRRCVLGAWGCGAYGNPVGDVARAWRRVLVDSEPGSEAGKAGVIRGSRKGERTESWEGLEEVVFAISSEKMAREFASAWGSDIDIEMGQGRKVEVDEGEEEDQVAEELRSKILEMEGQVAMVWNPELKIRLVAIVDGLKAQLREREGGEETQESIEEGEDASIERDEEEQRRIRDVTSEEEDNRLTKEIEDQNRVQK